MVRCHSAMRLSAVRSMLIGTLISICAAGCSQKKGPKLHPVSGKVIFDGGAPEGATVVFQPVNSESGALMPSGTVGSDGRFELTTHPHGPGAPEGDYIVLVTWYPPDARQSANARNQLPDRYADATQPLLRATVKAGKNEIEPFVLTK